jgi:small-conductance mechanosensitive channel
LLKAVAAGSAAALLLAAALGFLAAFFPTVAFHLLLRFFISFGVCWLLVQVVERFGGATGWPFTLLASTLSFVVMFSNFVALAIHAPAPSGATTTGTGPFMFAALNVIALAGILTAVYFTRED